MLAYKADSTNGRRYIYSISHTILKSNCGYGIGFQKFRVRFNEEQASYFYNHDIDSPRALLADNTFYAFNDYLQWIIETGLLGIIALLLFIFLLYRRIVFLNKTVGKNQTITAATSALICIGVAAMVSYPLQVIPIQAMALICLGILIFYPGNRTGVFNRVTGYTIKTAFVGFSVFFLIDSIRVLQRKAEVKKAFELVLTGYRTDAIRKYEQIISKHPGHGDIIYLYAEQLFYSNRLKEALFAVKRAREYYVDNKLYRLKAKIEDELNMLSDAEASYLHTIYMVPNRMASRFDLMNFYISHKDTLKTTYWANSILNMPIKVPSERTETMLQETRAILKQMRK